MISRNKRSVLTPPLDTPSDVNFNPIHDVFAVSSWDTTMRIYGNSDLDQKMCFKEELPVVCSCFSSDGNLLFGGLTNGFISLIDLQTSQTRKLSMHSLGVRHVKHYKNLLISGSFDKTIKFYDFVSNSVVHTIELSERLYCMDIKKDVLVCNIAGNKVVTYDLRNNCAEKIYPTKLNWQIRSIGAGFDNNVFCAGAIDGRGELFSLNNDKRPLIFKSSRQKDLIYPINTINFSPRNPEVLAAGGGDGSLAFFNCKNRIKILDERFESPVTCGDYNSSGTSFLVGIGYDWSKGYDVPPYKNDVIMVDVSNIKS